MGARQAVRSVGAALGMEAPRVNSVARQVPLLSSPGAIDSVMTRAPELGIADAGAGVEPYNTLVRVAGQLEGLPHRYGAHPSAYNSLRQSAIVQLGISLRDGRRPDRLSAMPQIPGLRKSSHRLRRSLMFPERGRR